MYQFIKNDKICSNQIKSLYSILIANKKEQKKQQLNILLTFQAKVILNPSENE